MLNMAPVVNTGWHMKVVATVSVWLVMLWGLTFLETPIV